MSWIFPPQARRDDPEVQLGPTRQLAAWWPSRQPRLTACALAATAIALAGCGVIPPRVAYMKYSDQAAVGASHGERRGYLFRHRRSVLIVQLDSKDHFEAVPAPFELAPDNTYTPLYEITGTDDLLSTTQLKPKYIENTRLIDELQVTTKDNLADVIAKIGTAAKAVAPLLMGETPTTAPRFVRTIIDPMMPNVEQWHADPLNTGYCLRLRDSTVESQTTLEAYVAAAAGRFVGSFPVPACATGIVEIAAACNPNRLEETKPDVSIRVTYAHPCNVLPMALPSTGSVKMHSTCSASVTVADKEDRTDFLDYLAKLIKTAQDVHSAWQSKSGTAKTAPANASTDKPAANKPKAGSK